jgi:hypothetical protein
VTFDEFRQLKESGLAITPDGWMAFEKFLAFKGIH